MAWADVGTWIGTCGSVVGMIIAIFQARKAGSAARRAEQMRDQISARKTQSELSNLNGLVLAAIRAMDKYGPGSGEISRRGNSPENDAASVRSLTEEMAHLRVILIGKFGSAIQEVIADLNQSLTAFTAAEEEDRVVLGLTIYTTISEFRGNLKEEIDKNIYR